MLKVYYKDNYKYNLNENKEKDLTKENSIKIELVGNNLTCYFNPQSMTDEENQPDENFDIVELKSYRSYILASRGIDNLTKRGRDVHHSTCIWIDMNRLGTATKDDYFKTLHNYNFNVIAQVDTGMITDTEKDIVITVIRAPKENITLAENTIGELAPESDLNGKYPRETLWDNYSLTVNGVEYKADRWGNLITRNAISDITCEEDKDYIEFTVKKYKGYFTETVLTRDIDNEEVFIDCSAGFCNPRRIKLVNGQANFRVYPFEYKGYVKIKLGRKWYSVWNDYLFNVV